LALIFISGSAGDAIMKAVKTYSTKVDADVAKIALAAADVPSVVVGVGTELEGGSAGVQLLVPDECVEAALRILERS
jgi:Putative prokaryotic signal transducing protein